MRTALLIALALAALTAIFPGVVLWVIGLKATSAIGLIWVSAKAWQVFIVLAVFTILLMLRRRTPL